MIIALAGRPNVGKSSLFNRLVGARKSLVWDQPGVTRDLVRGNWEIREGQNFEVWDLAGWGKFGLSFKNIPEKLSKKIDLILLVIDGSSPLTSEDLESFESVRRLNKPIFVILNKSDRRGFKDHSSEIYEHFQQPTFTMSAEQKSGISEVEDAVWDFARKNKLDQAPPKSEDAEAEAPRVLILGRPNVGKSTLINSLVGNDVSFVSDIPGTTRDLIEYRVESKGKAFRFIDSAGVRKKAKIYGRHADPIEIFSTEKALKMLQEVDLALLVVEAAPGAMLHTQDKKLLNLVRKTLTPTLLVVNKWDKMKSETTEKEYREELKFQLADLDFVPILFISAKTGFHLPKIFQLLTDISRRICTVPTPKLNRWLQKVLASKPPRVAKKGVKGDHFRTRTQYLHIQYAVHTRQRPMTFQFFCNAPQAVAEDDKRFLLKRLRQDFDLVGIPLKALFRKKN